MAIYLSKVNLIHTYSSPTYIPLEYGKKLSFRCCHSRGILGLQKRLASRGSCPGKEIWLDHNKTNQIIDANLH